MIIYRRSALQRQDYKGVKLCWSEAKQAGSWYERRLLIASGRPLLRM